MRFLTLIALLGCGVLLTTGCGGGTDYDLAPVSGVVKLDGNPMPGLHVKFQPKGGGEINVGPGSTGKTDENGRYVLYTDAMTDSESEEGAVVGTHTVRVYSYSPETPIVSDTDTGKSQEKIPDKYNYRTSLTFEVSAEGTDSADWELESN